MTTLVLLVLYFYMTHELHWLWWFFGWTAIVIDLLFWVIKNHDQ